MQGWSADRWPVGNLNRLQHYDRISPSHRLVRFRCGRLRAKCTANPDTSPEEKRSWTIDIGKELRRLGTVLKERVLPPATPQDVKPPGLTFPKWEPQYKEDPKTGKKLINPAKFLLPVSHGKSDTAFDEAFDKLFSTKLPKLTSQEEFAFRLLLSALALRHEDLLPLLDKQWLILYEAYAVWQMLLKRKLVRPDELALPNSKVMQRKQPPPPKKGFGAVAAAATAKKGSRSSNKPALEADPTPEVSQEPDQYESFESFKPMAIRILKEERGKELGDDEVIRILHKLYLCLGRRPLQQHPELWELMWLPKLHVILEGENQVRNRVWRPALSSRGFVPNYRDVLDRLEALESGMLFAWYAEEKMKLESTYLMTNTDFYIRSSIAHVHPHEFVRNWFSRALLGYAQFHDKNDDVVAVCLATGLQKEFLIKMARREQPAATKAAVLLLVRVEALKGSQDVVEALVPYMDRGEMMLLEGKRPSLEADDFEYGFRTDRSGRGLELEGEKAVVSVESPAEAIEQDSAAEVAAEASPQLQSQEETAEVDFADARWPEVDAASDLPPLGAAPSELERLEIEILDEAAAEDPAVERDLESPAVAEHPASSGEDSRRQGETIQADASTSGREDGGDAAGDATAWPDSFEDRLGIPAENFGRDSDAGDIDDLEGLSGQQQWLQGAWQYQGEAAFSRSTADGYISTKLELEDRRAFKAAGLILYMFDGDNKLKVLVAYRRNQLAGSRPGHALLGGERQVSDASAEATAIRQMTQDTAGVLSGYTISGESLQNVLWFSEKSYAFFMYKLPSTDFMQAIPRLFEAAKVQNSGDASLALNKVPLTLKWLSLEQLEELQSSEPSTLLSRVLQKSELVPWLEERQADRQHTPKRQQSSASQPAKAHAEDRIGSSSSLPRARGSLAEVAATVQDWELRGRSRGVIGPIGRPRPAPPRGGRWHQQGKNGREGTIPLPPNDVYNYSRLLNPGQNALERGSLNEEFNNGYRIESLKAAPALPEDSTPANVARKAPSEKGVPENRGRGT